MSQTTVYVETTVIGHLVGRILADPVTAGRQIATREWWPKAMERHQLFISRLVIDECGAGNPEAAAERLAAVNTLEILAASVEVVSLAELLIAGNAVPATEPRDAIHISLAAVHGIEYLVHPPNPWVIFHKY